MKEFDWDKFKGNRNICVHCKTQQEANEFCKMMDAHGMKWNDGGSYLSSTGWHTYKEDTVYYGRGNYCDVLYAINCESSMLEFSDYWKVNKVEQTKLPPYEIRITPDAVKLYCPNSGEFNLSEIFENAMSQLAQLPVKK